MYTLFINMSVMNLHFVTEERIAMRLIESLYCMTWIGLFIGPISNGKALLKRTIFGLINIKILVFHP